MLWAKPLKGRSLMDEETKTYQALSFFLSFFFFFFAVLGLILIRLVLYHLSLTLSHFQIGSHTFAHVEPQTAIYLNTVWEGHP
jgi:hypothetical protein